MGIYFILKGTKRERYRLLKSNDTELFFLRIAKRAKIQNMRLLPFVCLPVRLLLGI